MIRQMRRGTAIFAAAFVIQMISCAWALTAWAANGRIAFSDPSATVGAQVSVNMKVTSSENLASANVMLSYDSDALEFVSGTNAEGGAGAIHVRGDGGTPNTNTLAFTLKFNARAAGSSKITVTSQEVYDSNSQLVNVDQIGDSTVTVSALQTASKDATLQSLQVSPGTLTPPFSPDVDTYSVTVGTDVEKLIVTAKSTDENATNVVSGYEDLQMGENRVVCKVTAQDGETTKEYVIVVTKAEGGAGAQEAELATGVKMRISKREITVLEPDESVKIPEGFKESVINIDDNNKVRGWVWGGETEHQYCIVYGMNEAGEKDFYRYDMKDTERTIQRYFADPAVQSMVSKTDYDELAATYDKLCEDYKLFQIFLITAILIAVGLLVLLLTVVLKKKDKGPGGRGRAALRSSRGRDGLREDLADSPEDIEEDQEGFGDAYEDRGYPDDPDRDEGYPEEEYGDGGYPGDEHEDKGYPGDPAPGYPDNPRRDGGYEDKVHPEDGYRSDAGPAGRYKDAPGPGDGYPEETGRSGPDQGAPYKEAPRREEHRERLQQGYRDTRPKRQPSDAARDRSGEQRPPKALEAQTRTKASEAQDDGDDFEIFDL